MKVTYIYTLSDQDGNIRYVGKSNNPTKRLLHHKWNDRKCKLTSWLTSLRQKGLEPVLEVLDLVEENEWRFWEQFWISQCKTWGFKLTNMTEGGEGFASGDLNPAHLPHVKAIRSKVHKGKKLSKKTRDKISESLTGRKNPEHSKRMTGRTNSIESRIAQSKALSGIGVKLKKEDVLIIRKMLQEKSRVVEIAQKFNVDKSTIKAIRSNRIWKTVQI